MEVATRRVIKVIAIASDVMKGLCAFMIFLQLCFLVIRPTTTACGNKSL
jgi:hypothetical protein